MNELEITTLLNKRFYPYLTVKIIWHLRAFRQQKFQAVHHEINNSLIYLNSVRYPSYMVFFYAPNRRKYSNDSQSELNSVVETQFNPLIYISDISESDSDY